MTSLKRFSLALVFSLVLQICFPILGSLEVEKTYAYGSEIRAFEALGKVGVLSLETPKNSFTVRLHSNTPIEDENDVIITISDGKISKSMGLEIEGDEWLDGTYFTAPVHFAGTKNVQIEVTSSIPGLQLKTELVALDTESGTYHLTLNPDRLSVQAANGPKIITRADWGADESLRYKDSNAWKGYFANLEKHKDDPIPEATKKYNERIEAISNNLRTKFPEEFALSEKIVSENGHDLVWPIEKTKNVRKIVLHHTAENLLSDTTDEALMRSMYYYHTITRGWGDLGYNYIIGQRGVIYEGRAGGDYTAGAHAAWNNSGTVGISVIGNFEKDVLIKDQEDGIRTAISWLAKKYGIDVGNQTNGHKECKSSPDCLTTDSVVTGLVGHRDVGYTACPGANLYTKLASFQKDFTVETAGYKLVNNPVYKPETLVAATTNTKPQSPPPVTLSKGPMVRIKLSTPTDWKSIRLDAVSGNPILGFDKVTGGVKNGSLVIRKKGIGKLELVLDGKKYTGSKISLSADVVRISNWDRKPSWDTSGKLNDNVFRGKLEVRVKAGKLEVINELPLEDYLKGLAEISNGHNPEKVKTILVAARSYALWYTDPNNRKFPGKDYDGSDDPDVFQKYLGYGYETRSGDTAKLVEATNGQVVTYNGNLVKPWYFNDSDGRTRSAKEYCESNGGKNCLDIPYLQSVADPAGAGHTRKGHGVGVSGVGATYFATEKGWDYKAILAYYLTGTKVEKKY